MVLEVRSVPAGIDELEAQVYRRDPARSDGTYLGPSRVLEVWDGTATGRIGVPAGAEIHLGVTGPGVILSTRSEPMVLGEGEERSLVLDLGASCSVSGRVVDVPGAPMRSLSLVHRRRQESNEFLPPHPHPTQLDTRLDGEGRFLFAGLPRGAFAIELAVTLGRIPLVDDAGLGVWIACESGDLRLRPAEPVVGILPVDESGNPLADEPFALILNAGTSSDVHVHPDGVALARLEDVRDPVRIGVYLPRRGIFFRDPQLPAPVAGELLGIPAAESLVRAGSIRVVGEGPLAEDLIVDFQRHEASGPQRLLGLQVGVLRRGARAGAVRMERLEDGARLVGLPPGTYDLAWSWGGRRPFAEGLVVRADAETVVHAVAPVRSEARIRVERWEELPADVRPLELRIEGRSARVQDGVARIVHFEPMPEEAWVRARDFFWWSRPLPLRLDGDDWILDVPVEELRRITFDVEPLRMGRLVIQIEQPPELRARFGDIQPVRLVQPRADGRPELVYEAQHPPTGLVREYGAESQIVHGWFDLADLAPGERPRLTGRWCDLLVEPADLLLEVWFEGPSRPGQEPPHALAALVDTSTGTRIWVPAGTRALRFRDRLGREKRIELVGEPTELIIPFE